MAARNWTPEERARQSALIQRWQPWKRSTGARTLDGKAKVSHNAYKGGAQGRRDRLNAALQELDLVLEKVKKLSGKKFTVMVIRDGA